MNIIPDIIWILIGLLLFSLLLIVGFNTTLGAVLKTKAMKTAICFGVMIAGTALFIGCMVSLLNGPHGYGVPESTIISQAVGGGIGALCAAIAELVWYYKVKDLKPTKPKKKN